VSHTPRPVADRGPGELRREVLVLVGLVLGADALFIAAYFLFHLADESPGARLGFTAGWTLVTLAIALRSLVRIRAARLRARGARQA
jgi:hypothetical protein